MYFYIKRKLATLPAIINDIMYICMYVHVDNKISHFPSTLFLILSPAPEKRKSKTFAKLIGCVVVVVVVEDFCESSAPMYLVGGFWFNSQMPPKCHRKPKKKKIN